MLPESPEEGKKDEEVVEEVKKDEEVVEEVKKDEEEVEKDVELEVKQEVKEDPEDEWLQWPWEDEGQEEEVVEEEAEEIGAASPKTPEEDEWENRPPPPPKQKTRGHGATKSHQRNLAKRIMAQRARFKRKAWRWSIIGIVNVVVIQLELARMGQQLAGPMVGAWMARAWLAGRGKQLGLSLNRPTA